MLVAKHCFFRLSIPMSYISWGVYISTYVHKDSSLCRPTGGFFRQNVITIIWMRHAARLPPPPVFNDQRLVQLIASCKLQITDQTFGEYVFGLRLTLEWFCRYLYVLDVCCQVASWGDIENLQILLQQCFRNAPAIMQISIKTHLKSTKMVPRST